MADEIMKNEIIQAAAPEDGILLKTEKLCKSFGPTRANIDIDFSLKLGEIHGLVGENGSGKSTFLSQIAGMYQSDSGTMYYRGEQYAPSSPLDAYARSIGVVVQELGVIAALPLGMNVFLGRMDEYTKFGVVKSNKMYSDIRALATKWGIEKNLRLHNLAGNMNVESRKIIELLRALALDPELLILDEITQALSYNNRMRLHEIINRYKDMGRSVLLISHDLDEIVELADRITVLRDGEIVGTVNASEVTEDTLKHMMVGRAAEGEYYRADNVPSREDKIILEVRELTVGSEVNDISFDVHAGEILGFCGLSDSGIHTIGKALYGLENDAKGTVKLVEKGICINSSQIALRNKMAYVPKERDGEGLMIQAGIRENFCLPALDELKGPLGFLPPPKINAAANHCKDFFSVRCQNIFQRVSRLSGGNKQKINLGRWVAKDLALLILDCPTRGVDVGVKAYVYQLMKELKAKGMAIILISDELTEVLGMADRILIVKNGKTAKEIQRGADFSEEAVIEVMI